MRLYGLGRQAVTENPEDIWKLRTPLLQNVGVTMPYMHYAGFSTLREVLELYHEGAKANDGLYPALKPLGFSRQELSAIEAFFIAVLRRQLQRLLAKRIIKIPIITDYWFPFCH